MAKLTVNEAARAGYAARATIYRKINNQALPVETGERGQVVINTADLERIFGEANSHRETSPTRLGDISETAQLRTENALLRAENADLRLHRDRLMTLLEHTAPAAPATTGTGTLRRFLGLQPRTQVPR